MSETTRDEEQKARTDSFMKEYGELVAKHKIDFASFPVFVPDESGRGSFKVVCQSVPVDISNQPQKSPFIPQ
jgi:hypothetical protein